MNDLEEKLGELLEAITKDGEFISQREFLVFITEDFDPEHVGNPMRLRRDKAAAQIKQAFIDAGWRDLSSRGGLLHATVVDHRGRVDYMTGREWYDQFEKLVGNLEPWPYKPLHGVTEIDEADWFKSEALKAAKKASGLE